MRVDQPVEGFSASLPAFRQRTKTNVLCEEHCANSLVRRSKSGSSISLAPSSCAVSAPPLHASEAGA
jgi:hypothetical protein